MPSKGVTPIIALVLMLMIVVGLAGGVMTWINTMQSGMENKTEKHISHEIGKIMTDFRIISVSGNKIWIRNSGTLSLDTTKLGIFVDNQRVGFTDAGTVGAGETGELVISSDQIPSLAKKHNIKISSVSKGRSVSKRIGYALEFDGSDDYVEVPDDASLDLNDHTLTFWLKMKESAAATGNWDQIMVKGNGGTRTPGLWFWPDSNTIHWRLNDCNNGNAGVDATNTVFNVGEWYHLAGTYNSSSETLTVYVNGQADSSAPVCAPLSTNNDPFYMGVSPNYGSINLVLDDVHIYDRALSVPEVEDCYEGNCPASGLVSSWRMNEGTGCTASDSVGGNDGVLNPSCSPQWVS